MWYSSTNCLFYSYIDVDRRISLTHSYVCYLFQVHPINITEITESTKSPNTNLSTPWTVESGTMCELDVFVGNYAVIDWEVYSLWLSGRSIAEAGPFKIFLCEVVMKSTWQGVPNWNVQCSDEVRSEAVEVIWRWWNENVRTQMS